MVIVDNVNDFKRDFHRFLNQAGNGEEIVIKKGNHPFVKLTAYDRFREPWEPGGLRGVFKVRKDFDAPDREIAKLFGYES